VAEMMFEELDAGNGERLRRMVFVAEENGF
jgi:hypothetical protein